MKQTHRRTTHTYKGWPELWYQLHVYFLGRKAVKRRTPHSLGFKAHLSREHPDQTHTHTHNPIWT